MIHILLTILKIIGILLLLILGLLLGILLLVLFVPIHYELHVGINEETALDLLIRQAPGIDEEGKLDFVTNAKISAKITWLLRLVHVFVSFAQKQLTYFVKVLFFNVVSSKPRKEKKKKRSKAKKTKNPVSQEIQEPEESIAPVIQTPLQPETPVEEERPKSENTVFPDKTAKTAKPKKDITETVENLKGQVEKVFGVISDKENQEFVKTILLELKKLLWHIRPRKYNCFAYIGMEDPSVTGSIMMGYGIAKGIFGMEHLEIMPDFERKIVRVSAQVSGRIRLIHLLIIGCKVYFNKTFRKLIGGK